MRKNIIDFFKKIRDWDGFGVTYVETAQTADYRSISQDYGGFSNISEDSRQEILDMIFGNDGLKPGLTKMFLDPFHQEAQNLNPSDSTINLENYDHKSTTRWMRYFVNEGLKRIRNRKEKLEVITTLYGPPAWMTKQKIVRGRDLDPEYKIECAKYMISWARYLREKENIPVKYISLHNEGESYYRWPEDGSSSHLEHGHDYNLFWPTEQVVDFLNILPDMLKVQGMEDIGVTPGETTNWYKFHEWGYSQAIAEDEEVLNKLGLITSHGFVGLHRNPEHVQWYGDYRSIGNDLLREKRPELHSWVTSFSWDKMDYNFVNDIRHHIYSTKINALIPWAIVQWQGKWKGGDPNSGTAFRVYDDGSYSVEPGYYYYKQICRAGQAGMSVAPVVCNDSELGLIGFGNNGSANSDSFVVINLGLEDKKVEIELIGTDSHSYSAYRTSKQENYVLLGDYELFQGRIKCNVPGQSVTTFFGN